MIIIKRLPQKPQKTKRKFRFLVDEKPAKKTVITQNDTDQPPVNEVQKETLFAKLSERGNELRIERGKLSNQYLELEKKGAPVEHFRQNYQAIQALTKELGLIARQKEEVKKHGKIIEKTTVDESVLRKIDELSGKKKQLTNKKYRLNNKLKNNPAKYKEGTKYYQETVNEIAKIEVMQEEMARQIKELRNATR